MTSVLISVILWIWDNRSFDAILKGNRAKIEAQTAFRNKNYQAAIVSYEAVINASLFVEPEARLNLAHAYFMAKQEKKALKLYDRLGKLKNKTLASEAETQIGNVYIQRKDTALALNSFKKALLLDEENKIARFNYEVLKNEFSGEETQIQKEIAQNKSKSESIQKETMNVAQVQTEQKKNVLKRLKTMKMTEEQAIALLEAIRTTETDYLQNRKIKVNPTKDKGEW